MAKLLSSLPIGAKVKDPNTRYYGKPIIWMIIDKNHPGYPTNSVTLLTEKIITLKAFDAKEPSNPNTNRQNYGNNRYAHSNIRQWLNKDTSPWYSAQHSYDAPPNSSNVGNGHNEYEAEAGFLSNFSAELKSKLLLTTLTVAKNTVTDGGGSETVQDKVFLLSETEVGLGNENGIAEGTPFSFFNSDTVRQAYPTLEAVSNSEYKSDFLNTSQPWYWWLRTPHAGDSCDARCVSLPDGLTDVGALFGHHGVRPALNLPSDILVSDSPDTDGAYIIQWNAVPTITLNTTDNRTLYENDTLTISGSVTDLDSGNVVNVKYQIDNGTPKAITAAISSGTPILFNKVLTFKSSKLYDGTTAVTDTLAENTQHILKVWAEDDQGGKSAEQTRIFYVVANRPAVLTIDPVSAQTGLIDSDQITISGSVSDPDNNTIKVQYKINSGSFTEVYNGQNGTFSFQVPLSALNKGSNTIVIQAIDSYNAITTKTLSVTKTENAQPLQTSVTRYKLTPPNGTASGVVLWIQREAGDLVVDAEISMTMNGEEENFQPMTKTSTAYISDEIEEDEFIFDAGEPKENIVIQLTMTRSDTSSDKAIKLVSGVLN